MSRLESGQLNSIDILDGSGWQWCSLQVERWVLVAAKECSPPRPPPPPPADHSRPEAGSCWI